MHRSSGLIMSACLGLVVGSSACRGDEDDAASGETTQAQTGTDGPSTSSTSTDTSAVTSSATGTAGGSTAGPADTSSSSSGSNTTGGVETSGTTGAVGPDCDIGEPLRVVDLQWTTIRTPGTSCGNNGEAGYVVNPSPSSANLLIYFLGGGACFNENDCGASLLGGFGDQEAIDLAEQRALLARDNPNNPFAEWDYVFIPYCTGDFHSGDNVATYGTAHVGHANVAAHLQRIVPTFCDAEHVVVTGTSAGGFGSTFAYIQIHEAFGSLPVDLIADSGPYMTAEYMPESMQAMVDDNWGFRANMPADCEECATHWDALYPYIAQRWPDDRMSLLSYTSDPSIQGRFDPYTPLDDLPAFEAGLNALADEVLVPLPNFRVFFRAGNGHVLLNAGNPFGITQNETTLGEFIVQQIEDDPAWADVRP